MQLPRALLSPSSKDRKTCSEKNSYIFPIKWNFLIYQEKEHSYISGKRNPKKCLIFQGRTSELKKLNKATVKKYIFENEVRNLKNSLYFRRELAKLENKKITFFVCCERTFNYMRKRKKFLIVSFTMDQNFLNQNTFL